MWISFLFELQIAKEPKKQRKNFQVSQQIEKLIDFLFELLDYQA